MEFKELWPKHEAAPPGRFLLLAAALTALVRISYMIFFESWDFKHEWAFGHEMGRLGQWLAEGKGFTLDGSAPTAKFPPFYPLVVGGVFYLLGPYAKSAAIALFMFQTLCSALIAVCLAILGSRLLGRTTGIIASLLWAFYPTSIFYSVVRIWYCELALFLVLVITLLAVRANDFPPLRRAALMGALSGVAVLTDSTMALYLPLLFLGTLLARRLPWPGVAGLVAVWVLAAGVVTSPWIARNWMVFGSPVLLKTNLGAELLSGTATTSRRELIRSLDQKEILHYRRQSEVEYNRYLRARALERIRENPLQFLSATVKRFGQFWVFNPRVGSESYLRLAFFGPLLLLALYGIYRRREYFRRLAPVFLFLLVYPLPYYIIHVDRGRYSYPVEPFIVLLAAGALAVWYNRGVRALSS